MPYFKSWKEIEESKGGPTEAEKKLKAALEGGWICDLGPKNAIPPTPDDWSALPTKREIRADVLRFLLVHASQGGVQPHELGLQLAGAYISGKLNLNYSKIETRVAFSGCRFQDGFLGEHSRWEFGLRLTHCYVPFFQASGCKVGAQFACDGIEIGTERVPSLVLQGAEIKKDFSLRAAKINGPAHLFGIRVDGQMTCQRAEFQSSTGPALNLEHAEISGSLLCFAAKFKGSAHLSGLRVGGQLNLEEATLSTPKSVALNLQGATVNGDVFLRRIKSIDGEFHFNAEKMSSLVDDKQSMLLPQKIVLDGLNYDRIVGPTDAKTRLEWLSRGDTWNGQFYPQPYKQLAKVLHDMGHEADSRIIRYELAQKLATNDETARERVLEELAYDPDKTQQFVIEQIRYVGVTVWNRFQKYLTGFGYYPFRSLFALILLLFLSYWPAQWAWEEGSFAPNSAPILASAEWKKLADKPNPAALWSGADAIPGKDWETFNAFAYAADVVIPIVEFGQTDAWAPSTEREWWGKQLWWLRWVFTIAGWIVTALGAAALTGIIRRE